MNTCTHYQPEKENIADAVEASRAPPVDHIPFLSSSPCHPIITATTQVYALSGSQCLIPRMFLLPLYPPVLPCLTQYCSPSV